MKRIVIFIATALMLLPATALAKQDQVLQAFVIQAGGTDFGNVTVTGGTIDGVIIGGTTPAAGTFDPVKTTDTNDSNALSIIWNENDTSDRTINIVVNAGDRTLDLSENLTVGGGLDFTLTAEDAAGSIVLDEQTLEIEGEGTATQLTKLINANNAAATVTIEGTSAVVNQDTTSDATVTFGTVTAQAASSAAANIFINASAAEQNADKWKISAADGGNLTIETGQSGSYVAICTYTNAGAQTCTGTVTGSSLAAAASADPLLQMTQSGGDGSVGFEMDIDATTVTAASEDYDVAHKAMIGGSLDTYSFFDADSAVVLDNGIDSTYQLGNTASPATPRLYAATYTSAETLETEECYNSTIYISGATVITLPVMGYGMQITFITLTANAISVDANGADDTDLDGVASGVGEKSTSQGTVGEVIVYTWLDADGWYATSDGWTDGGA
ncbi:hypothetical protein LCGC14_0384360 [marine sediment metagenome]|uniref:Uncharacterized protein n=1 Tax=marine sediment metagenome TaxID=412755 RepID=A0A0F9TJH9_9ZZZZ